MNICDKYLCKHKRTKNTYTLRNENKNKCINSMQNTIKCLWDGNGYCVQAFRIQHLPSIHSYDANAVLVFCLFFEIVSSLSFLLVVVHVVRYAWHSFTLIAHKNVYRFNIFLNNWRYSTLHNKLTNHRTRSLISAILSAHEFNVQQTYFFFYSISISSFWHSLVLVHSFVWPGGFVRHIGLLLVSCTKTTKMGE